MNILINGKEKNIGNMPDASYEMIIGWAGFHSRRNVTVTYSTPPDGAGRGRSGHLRSGRRLELSAGLAFHVVDTESQSA